MYFLNVLVHDLFYFECCLKCSRLREQSKFSDDIIILEDWLLAIDHYHHSSSQLARELRKLMILAKFQVLCITSITFLSPEMSSALTVMKTVPCSQACVEAPLVRVAHSQWTRENIRFMQPFGPISDPFWHVVCYIVVLILTIRPELIPPDKTTTLLVSSPDQQSGLQTTV